MEAKGLINNLMIGDWFRGPDPTPIRITRIDSRGMLVENQDTDEVGLEDLQPIPLTEDILLKNGFEDFGRYFRLQDDILMIHRNGGKLWVIIGTWAIDIQYVHKLQHLLRFCGLNELADNFKIE